MRWFTLTVLASLTLVVAVNGIATLDRARQDARLGLAASALRPGLAMVFNGFVDERRLQKARLEIIERPRVIVFGSSRVRKISGALVHAAPGDFYNLGMSAAVVEDYIGLWSLIEERGIRPDIAVFGVDAWVFNANHEQNLWHALAPEVSRFLGSSTGRSWTRWPVLWGVLGGGIKPKSCSPTRYCRHPFGISSAPSSAGSGVGMTCSRRSPAILSRSRPRRPAGHPRGRQRHPSSSDATPAQIRDAVLGHVRTGPHGLVDFQWNREAAVSLERRWRDMRARGVELVVYTPPYHPAAWAALRREPRYRAALDSTAVFLARLSREVGARFLDASDPAVIPCDERAFYAMQHATAPRLDRLWKRLFP